MNRRVLEGLSALMIGWSVLSTPAAAQSLCGDHAEVAKKLETGYGEQPVSVGLSNTGSMIQVFASPAGTFTIVLTRPDGLSCLMSAGEGWQILPAPVKDAGV